MNFPAGISQNPFLQRLFASLEQVYEEYFRGLWRFYAFLLKGRIYESQILQEKARKVIPVEELKSRARRNYNFSADVDEKNAEFRDFLLLELLNWFKNEFFAWTDKPKCSFCGSQTKFHANVDANFEEKANLANRVENYVCENGACSNFTRFARFNDPAKLLETRTGRCGEWANCFTLCARSLGYEVRYVLDTTDHVWTEVWSEKQKRWLHCDPCENACDTPLIYEQGWGKKLSHVTAFGKDHVTDVAWRYSIAHRSLIKRRAKICSESELAEILRIMNSLLTEKYVRNDVNRRKELQNREIQELVEFICPRKQLKDSEKQGRISGSLNWRLQRGELGEAMTSLNLNDQSKFGHVITPDQSELEAGHFSIEYFSFGDFYTRNQVPKIPNFQSLLFECENLQRKLEYDWKQVYVCRRENCDQGFVVYKFQVKQENYGFEKIHIFLQWTIFDEGQVRATICHDDGCQLLMSEIFRKLADVKLYKFSQTDDKGQEIDLNGCREFKIRIDLSAGGQSSTFWQKSQLFRAPFDSNDHCSLKFEVKLKKTIV